MNYKILNISTLLGVSMLSAATSSKNVWNRTLVETMRVQAAQSQKVLPMRAQEAWPALAVQPQLALATQASQTAVTPEDILKGSYPEEWNDYSINDMFGMLNKNPDERVDPLLLKHWIHAIYACFNDFDNGNPKIKAINYARTIYTLAKYTQGYKNPESDTLINALLTVWSQRAPVQQFNPQDIANSLWGFAKLGKKAPDALLQSITDENIGGFNAQNIANSLWALATLGQQAPDALLQSITDENIVGFNAQNIANSLWGFAKLGKQAPAALLQSITERNIHTFNAQNIASCLWAFSVMKYANPSV
ncbi:MAG: hypothetical protein NEHIOOID_00855 [Holosporales bacterium]